MDNLPVNLPASTYIIIALIMIIANAGTEIIKSLILALSKKNGKSEQKVAGNNPINFHNLEATINSLHEILSKTDEKGTPLCYAPKAIELQQRILDRLDTISKLLSK